MRVEQLQAMLQQLAHRGPDDEGFHCDDRAALGNRRLSIIDLGGGRQPIPNEDETIWVVLNGEIYNYRQLRKELVARGHRFRTQSDTEVIVHLYEEHGTGCVERLRGMFAFAIWDSRHKRLFAARDHLGQKPFFYTQTTERFAFASEIKALLATDPRLAQLDSQALDQYLALRVILPPRTMFQQIRKLPPAHWLSFDSEGGRLEVRRYWDLEYEPKLSGSDEELTDELEQRLIDCLRIHMVSDVPVGAFVSGGLDSTLLVALLMSHVLGEPLDTFAGSLAYGDWDEAPFARMVADRYATRHHERPITPSLVGLLPRISWHLDEPSDPLAVCSYLIARIAREHVKVVLGGDGGDELFGGYDRYYGNRYAGTYSRVPELVRRGLGPLVRRLPEGGWYKSRSHQINWMHSLSFLEGGARYARSLSYFYFGAEQRKELYTEAMARAVGDFDAEAPIREAYDRAHAEDAVDRMLYADSQLRMPDHSVMILDRMTMAHGLEARSPFLDHELAAFAARLPPRLKVRGRSLRRIQTRLARRYLPRPLLERPKQGFSSALPYMLRDEYSQLFDVFLRSSHLARSGHLRQAGIERLLAAHLRGEVDHGNRLWLLLNAEVWFRLSIEGAAVADLTEAASGGSLAQAGESA